MGKEIMLNYTNLTQTVNSNSEICYTNTIPNSCKHKNGWYGIIPFWIFSKRIFACSDCGKILYGKSLNECQKRKKLTLPLGTKTE